jgi:hypothetical protein
LTALSGLCPHDDEIKPPAFRFALNTTCSELHIKFDLLLAECQSGPFSRYLPMAPQVHEPISVLTTFHYRHSFPTVDQNDAGLN